MTIIATPGTACPAWCTDHSDYGGEDTWHGTLGTEVAGAEVYMTDGALDGRPRIFGLNELPEDISMEDASTLALLLVRLVDAGTSGQAVRR